ncbi:SIR2 family protein [Mucilaginibacter sp. HMF5004]|uniref:SIR2 family protein n=1 Tax=Mucilaginibacter rivuli TaxID=2857527 RepID=UPI001C5F0CD2|nr:SIR2 family protein [Mucilaginibacter rivuli]MBW4888479.1 SIR2 family protein [Mucilaginibacter rivuli]
MKHFFYKGKNNVLQSKDLEEFGEKIKIVKKDFSKLLESRNLSFLIGSGCSLGAHGIPTMMKLAEGFFEPTEEITLAMSPKLRGLILSDESKKLLGEYKIAFNQDPFVKNLETFLGTLYSLRFYLEQIKDDVQLVKVDIVINETKHFILYQCLNKDNEGKDIDIQNNYKSFYRKLSLRDSNLPKPNVFTTNYDLYSEKAMDELGITYTNGFSGFIERYFNPSIFNYALAEQMDVSSSKWNVIDSYVYLFKIHGSVNWIEVEDSNKLFRIKELQDSKFEFLKEQTNLMIYPSPIKQNASLGTPYTDLFREFQKRIAQNQSVLVTMGYSFADEHINNLIFQALTIPTFRLVIFSDLGYHSDGKHISTKANIEKLKALNDPRIWIIGSDDETNSHQVTIDQEDTTVLPTTTSLDEETFEKPETTTTTPAGKSEKHLHFFNTICDDLLPDWSENIIEDHNEQILNLINSKKSNSEGATND